MSCATARVTFYELAVGASSRHGNLKTSATLIDEWCNDRDLKEEIRPELMRYRKYTLDGRACYRTRLTMIR